MSIIGAGDLPDILSDEPIVVYEEGWYSISQNDPVQPGDILRFKYRTIGLVTIQAVQLALIENKLEARPEFFVKSIRIDGSLIIVEVEVKQAALTSTGYEQAMPAWAIIVIVSAVVGIVLWASFAGAEKYQKAKGQAAKEVQKLLENPAAKAFTIGSGALLGAAAIALGSWALSKFR